MQKSKKSVPAKAPEPVSVSANVSGAWGRSIAHLAKLSGVDEKELELIQTFAALNDDAKMKAGRTIIEETVIDASATPDRRFGFVIAESETLLSGYATLDEPHRVEIQQLINNITAYLRDTTRQRPFNALMLAAPGAGKSHFIKQLASKMKDDRVQAVTFNMATMQSTDDLARPIDELRNLKVNDRFPLFFLDEFDSDPTRYAVHCSLCYGMVSFRLVTAI